MSRERIEIFADRRFAFIFFAVLLCLSVWLIIYFWLGGKSVIGIIIATIGGLLIGLLSTFGLFTIFSDKFVYFGPRTKEYEKHQLGANSKPLFIIKDDRLQSRVNFKKKIYFKDIISISLIPVYDSQYEGVLDFIEIKTRKTRMVLTDSVREFVEKFKRFNGESLELPTLNLESANKRFGSTKFFFISMLGVYSPLKIKLWDKKKPGARKSKRIIMKGLKKLFADFNNVDTKGRVRLNTHGTLSDIRTSGIELKEGLKVILDDDDGLRTVGIVEYSEKEKIWVAKIKWDSLKES